MARRSDQNNISPIRSKNMSDIGQTLSSLHVPGKTISVPLRTPTNVTYGKICRLTTENTNTVSVAFGGSSIGSTAIACVADVAGSLDRVYFILQDAAGSVAFWIDVDNSGSLIPAGASAADRAVEITTITTAMTAAQVGTAVYNAVTGDAQFEAGTDDLVGNITVGHVGFSNMVSVSAGDSGFAFMW